MFENIMNFFKKLGKKEDKAMNNSRDAAKERLHLVLMQDRANVSADFLELMKQEIIEVIKKYIDVDENAIDVRLTNKENSDGTNGAPALYANIPILNIKNEARKKEVVKEKQKENEDSEENKKEEVKKKKTIKENKEENKEELKDEEVKKNKKTKEEKEEKEDNIEKETIKEKTKEKIKSEK